jgi:7,8-dihydro-6-hydroxymethylpterin-pyrophosphokinase
MALWRHWFGRQLDLAILLRLQASHKSQQLQLPWHLQRRPERLIAPWAAHHQYSSLPNRRMQQAQQAGANESGQGSWCNREVRPVTIPPTSLRCTPMKGLLRPI